MRRKLIRRVQFKLSCKVVSVIKNCRFLAQDQNVVTNIAETKLKKNKIRTSEKKSKEHLQTKQLAVKNTGAKPPTKKMLNSDSI